MSLMYTLDSSLFINGWRKVYKPSVFPGVWAAIDHAFREGWAISCFDVLAELRVKDDEIKEWANKRVQYFPQPTERCLLKLRDVMEELPGYIRHGGAKNKADPVVIASAMVTDTAVVTFETLQAQWNPASAPKMPNACEKLKVSWLVPQDFLEAIGQQFK